MSSPNMDADGPVANRGPAVFAVSVATLVLASVFVAARMVCRYFIVKKLSWDDKVMALAWLIAFWLSFTVCLGAVNGLGKHDVDIPEHQLPRLRRCEYVFSILYNPALMAAKTSVLIFYLRLAKHTQVVLRYASWATLIVVNVAGTVLTFMNIFQCSPVDAAWNVGLYENAQCIPLLTEFICAAPVNVITDLAILALPIPVLTSMRLPSRQKTILVLTFALGIFVTIVDVVRIYYLQRAITDIPQGVSSNPEVSFGGQANFPWNASLSFMWSVVEVNVGMTCACVPTLKPLILKLLPAMLYDPDGTRSGSSVVKGPSDAESPMSATHPDITQPPAATLPNHNQSGLRLGPDAPMSAMEFLTTPDTAAARPDPGANDSADSDELTRSHTYMTNSTVTQENAVYFGFVNMAKPKSMLRTNASESWKYCCIVSTLFFLWGFSYGLLNTLNNVVAEISNMSTAQTLGLTSMYFGAGYFFGPLLVGGWILRRDEHNRTRRHQRDEAESVGGYKVTFITGLCIYGIGTIIFWPSAVLSSYGGFMISSFVVGFGLAVLEVGANSFMVLCGPPEYGETRLLLAQGVQGIGSVLSALLAQKVFFQGLQQNEDQKSLTLINVQWTYLGITLLCVALGLFFFYMPLPEVSDRELKLSEKTLPLDPKKRSIGGFQLRTISLTLAVAAQFLYVGAQECYSIYFRGLLVSILPGQTETGHEAVNGQTNNTNPDRPPGISLSIPDYLLVAHTAFAVSRFLFGYLTYLSVTCPKMPKPRTLLTISIALCFLFALLPVVVRPPNPNLLVIPVILYYFAQGPVWPLIYAIGLRGQGHRTKRAAAFITMGASGAGFFPFIMYGIITTGGTVRAAFIVIIALQGANMCYPIFLDFVKDAKLMVDPSTGARRNLGDDSQDTTVDELVMNRMLAGSGDYEKRGSLLGKFAHGFGAKFSTSRRRSSQPPQVEHGE
ncbi:L-fucose-proton symporter [Paramyrothecium foliicola]|nr:L-fucose-proton symporter [Paramyrothecium foliicola]